MRKLGISLVLIFLVLVGVYFAVFRPEKYVEEDLYSKIKERGTIKVGVNMDSRPFAYYDKNGNLQGYDIDLARYIAQYLLHSPNAVEFSSVTSEDRMLKVSTGEVDMVIATLTITPQRQELIDFSVPYDVAGQALLVRTNSKITSITDLYEQNIGVVFGTTAEKNMLTLAPMANIIGFKDYDDAYKALKNKQIDALTSDDTLLSRYAYEDPNVKLLPKKYSKEPYGVAFKKGESTKKLRENVDYALKDMYRKNVIVRIHKKWLKF